MYLTPSSLINVIGQPFVKSQPVTIDYSLSEASCLGNPIFPIRALSSCHSSSIFEHLKSLSSRDRFFRFGFLAADDQVSAYVDRLDFGHDEVFGVHDCHLNLVAMAHLAYSSAGRSNGSSEFGVSVLSQRRGLGYGTQLFERAVMHARNEGVSSMYVHVLSENTAMLKIAMRAGSTISRDGADSEAYLRLPAATFQTQMAEMMEEHFAQTNYRITAHSKQFWDQVSRFSGVWSVAVPPRCSG